MELLIEFAKILLPAALVLYAMYLTVRTFLYKEIEKKLVDIKTKNTEIILPLRLQAYERICLFLERISPIHLLPRVNNPEYSSEEFQQQLVQNIREEFTHNLSQQIYMSSIAWDLTKKSMEDIIALINQSNNELRENASGLDLAKTIFEKLMQNEWDPTADALKALKEEIRELF